MADATRALPGNRHDEPSSPSPEPISVAILVTTLVGHFWKADPGHSPKAPKICVRHYTSYGIAPKKIERKADAFFASKHVTSNYKFCIKGSFGNRLVPVHAGKGLSVEQLYCFGKGQSACVIVPESLRQIIDHLVENSPGTRFVCPVCHLAVSKIQVRVEHGKHVLFADIDFLFDLPFWILDFAEESKIKRV